MKYNTKYQWCIDEGRCMHEIENNSDRPFEAEVLACNKRKNKAWLD